MNSTLIISPRFIVGFFILNKFVYLYCNLFELKNDCQERLAKHGCSSMVEQRSPKPSIGVRISSSVLIINWNFNNYRDCCYLFLIIPVLRIVGFFIFAKSNHFTYICLKLTE